MLNEADLAYNAFQVLHAFYWVMTDILGALEDAIYRASGGVKLHLMLVGKRVNLIVEQLRIALEQAGIKLGEEIMMREVRRRIGALSLETLESVRGTVKTLIKELAAHGECNVSKISSKLMEFADVYVLYQVY